MNKNRKTEISKALISTSFLYYTSLIIGLLIIIFGLMLPAYVDKQHPSEIQSLVVIASSLPWLIFTSIIMIVRKEVPRLGMKSIQGGWAVFQGYLGLIACGYGEIFCLYLLFQIYFGQQ